MLFTRLRNSILRRSTKREKSKQEIQTMFRKKRREIKSHLYQVTLFFLITFGYVVLGIFLFFYIEECLNENSHDDQLIKNLCKQLYRNQHNIGRMNSTKINITTNATEERTALQDKHFDCVSKLKALVQDEFFHHNQRNCTLSKTKIAVWLEFVVATIHTIGYGTVVPTSNLGKIATLLYAGLGIPLALILYTTIGNFLISIINMLIDYIEIVILGRKRVNRRNLKIAIANSIIFLIVFFFACTTTAHEDLENLSWLDNMYFWCITLSTVGYGDLTLHFEDYFVHHPELVLPIILLLITGMSMMATLLSTFILVISSKDSTKGVLRKLLDFFSCEKKKDRYSEDCAVEIIEEEEEYQNEKNPTEL